VPKKLGMKFAVYDQPSTNHQEVELWLKQKKSPQKKAAKS
jgi:hypothetical protein